MWTEKPTCSYLLTSFFTILEDKILSTIAASSSLGFSYTNAKEVIIVCKIAPDFRRLKKGNQPINESK